MPHPQSPAARHFDWHSLPGIDRIERVEAVFGAIRRARRLIPAEIARATGQELHAMVAGLVPGLLLALGVMAVTTLGGAAAGAALGALAAGIGAAPGAAVGAALGAEAGAAILESLGLAFLVIFVGESMARAGKKATRAVEMAWHSVDHQGSDLVERATLDRAGQVLAEAVADLFRGVLQGVVAFLLSKGAGAAKAQVPELTAKLRASKLGSGFATWVEQNWEGLVKNPKLQPGKAAAPGGGGGGGAGAGSAAASEAAAGAARPGPRPGQAGGPGVRPELPPAKVPPEGPPNAPPARRIPVTGSRLEAVHDGAPHNQDWNKITVSDFNASRPEGLQTLSQSDARAAKILKGGGYPSTKVKEILNSGQNFAPRPLTKGEAMYGFDSADYIGKDADSAYWMDEAGYKDVESRFKQGDLWDRQGVKNYLALPCFNKADGLVQGVVSEDHLGVQSTIGHATENVTYQAADGTVVPRALSLPGGGQQVTPAVGKVIVPAGEE